MDTGEKMVWDTGFETGILDTHALNLGYWDTEFGILDTGILKLGYWDTELFFLGILKFRYPYIGHRDS